MIIIQFKVQITFQFTDKFYLFRRALWTLQQLLDKSLLVVLFACLCFFLIDFVGFFNYNLFTG